MLHIPQAKLRNRRLLIDSLDLLERRLGAMNQPRRSSRLRQGSGSIDRIDEKRAAVAQMMAENREGLGMRVIAIMVQRYGVLPKDMWDLNSVSDMGAGRGVNFEDEDFPEAMFESIISNVRYSIVDLTIAKEVSHKVDLPGTLRRLTIVVDVYEYALDLPESLQELTIWWYGTYNYPLVLPEKLRKLGLCGRNNLLVKLPPNLIELELGWDYNQPIVLPSRLKQLTFHPESTFDLPLALPPSLVCVLFGEGYNQPTTLPPHIEELRVGKSFSRDLTFPDSLRKIVWDCDCPIRMPEGVSELALGWRFNQRVVLPASLKKFTFSERYGPRYSFPVELPDGLEDFSWYPKDYDSLVLPAGLQKLIWGPDRVIDLPLGLKELVIKGDAPLVLPEGLLKFTADYVSSNRHYKLPKSVQEVRWKGDATFSYHPPLPHLTLGYIDKVQDLSNLEVHKLTLTRSCIAISHWPQGLKQVEFTEFAAEQMYERTVVPKGCRIVGEKWPYGVTMADHDTVPSKHSQVRSKDLPAHRRELYYWRFRIGEPVEEDSKE